MTANPHLKAYLENYLALPNPGFAIMINAPWGAGKSHAIKTFMAGRTFRLVSLFGVATKNEIEEAIFKAQVAADGAAGATKMMKNVSKYTEKFGVYVDAAFRQKVLAELPPILVFDDLERTDMSAKALFGGLNKYVEHDKRSIILLADETKLQSGLGDYKDHKEKTVGRTLRLNPDVAAAFPAFLAEITDPATKSALGQNQARIIEVFTLSAFENLRLLRHATLEFTQLYAALDADMRAKTAAVSDLIATYFALHMEYGKGGLTLADLAKRGGWERAMRSQSKTKGESKKSAMELAAVKYQAAHVDIYEDGVLGRDLAIDLIVNGHAEPDAIRTALNNTNGFANPQNEQPWRTLWWWRMRSEDQFSAALQRVETDLANHIVTNPHVLMHIFGIFLGLAKEDGLRGPDVATVVSDAKSYIDALQAAGTLPPWDQSSGGGELIDREADDGLSYANREDAEFADILDHLKSASSAAFAAQAKTVAGQLLAKIPDDLADVIQILTSRTTDPGRSGYLTAMILTYLDPALAAATFVRQSHETTEDLFKALVHRVEEQKRRRAGQAICDAELDWRNRFKNEVEKLANASSPHRKAQLKTYIRWHLAEITDPPKNA